MHLEEFERFVCWFRGTQGGSLVVFHQPHLANETPGMGENVFKIIETTLVSQGCLGMVA